MTGKLTPRKRSWNIPRIKGQDTASGLAVSKMPHSPEYRFRLRRKDLPSRPEIVLPKYKEVIFVRECFWHPYRRKDPSTPERNTGFRPAKLADNARRDIENQTLSKQQEQNVQVIWKHEIRDTEAVVRTTGVKLYKCSKPAPN